MKKRKGFTLVELLAVIAILAILVIMALPAVLRMYRQSRINNFQNEVRSTYRTAQNQFLADSMLLESGQNIVYTNGSCSSTTSGDATNGADEVKTLDMTGNSNFKYLIDMTVSGQVQKVRATNGTYSYKYDVTIAAGATSADGIKVEDIVVEGTGSTNQATFDTTINVCTGLVPSA